jgi:glutaredoxin
MNRLLFLSLGLAALAAAEAATLYKWVDKEGRVSYQDRPPPPDAGQVEEKALLDGQPRVAPPPPPADAAAKHPVTLYSIPKCAPCDMARLHLQRRKIPFSEKNVSPGNSDNQKEMLEKVGELVVPTITVGSKIMRGGYVESLLDGELDQAGYPKAEEARPEPGAEAAPPAAAPAP